MILHDGSTQFFTDQDIHFEVLCRSAPFENRQAEAQRNGQRLNKIPNCTKIIPAADFTSFDSVRGIYGMMNSSILAGMGWFINSH